MCYLEKYQKHENCEFLIALIAVSSFIDDAHWKIRNVRDACV